MKNYRHEAVSGVFYKSSGKELRVQVKKCFLNENFGPKKLPESDKTDEFKAFIVPHAGLDYSGPCAAHAYKKIGENSKPEIIVLIGPNHSGYGNYASLYPNGYWMTPLGDLRIDKAFNELLMKNPDFVPNELSHAREHSLEVQTPFIKYLYGNDSPTIVPVLVNTGSIDKKVIKKLGAGLFNAWMKSGKRVLFIASSDLSHVGKSYGYMPFKKTGKELVKKIKEMDKKLLDYIINLDIDNAIDYAREKKLTICGLSSILVLLQLFKLMKGKTIKGELLKHYTSAEISNNYTNFVDYASIEFKA